MSRSRAWCFTWNNPTRELTLDDFPTAQYLLYQRELGASGTPHFQGYLEFPTRITLGSLRGYLDGAHYEVRKGSQSQACDYCRKEEGRLDGPFEFGSRLELRPGKRTDLDDLARDLYGGVSVDDLRERYPGHSLRYRAAIQASARDINWERFSRVLRPSLRCIVLWGDPGTGKTRSVYDRFGLERVFTLNTSTSGSLWFDGYQDEPVLLIDDFRGWIRFQEVLKICDIYPYRCPVKGSFLYAGWYLVVFTSNHPFSEWWRDESGHCLAAFSRRICKTVHFSLDHPWRSDVDVFADVDLDESLSVVSDHLLEE